MKKNIFLALLLLAFFNCCKDEKDEDVPQGITVRMNSNSFLPSSISVSVGTTVKWVNNSQVRHTITSESGLFNESLPPGSEFGYTFSDSGIYNYVCTIHPGMSGTIVVE